MRRQSHHNLDCQLEVGTEKEFCIMEIKPKSCHVSHEIVKQVLEMIKSKPSDLNVAAFRWLIANQGLYGHNDQLSFCFYSKLKYKSCVDT